MGKGGEECGRISRDRWVRERAESLIQVHQSRQQSIRPKATVPGWYRKSAVWKNKESRKHPWPGKPAIGGFQKKKKWFVNRTNLTFPPSSLPHESFWRSEMKLLQATVWKPTYLDLLIEYGCRSTKDSLLCIMLYSLPVYACSCQAFAAAQKQNVEQ